MRTHILLTTIVCFTLAFATSIHADEQRDAADLEQLLAQVQKVVPPGWSADFQLVDRRVPSRRGSHPAIVIKSDAELPVEYCVPNPAPGEPDVHQEFVTIHFVAFPYMTPENHLRARKINYERLSRRLDFERAQLKNVQAFHMGPQPIPPSSYKPQNEDEAKLIRRYAFLWAATEPLTIPTHHTDQLAFEMRDLPIKIHDADQAKEYQQILDAVQKIVVPYEKEK